MGREDDAGWYTNIAKSWKRAFMWWYSLHWSLGILAIILSTLVATDPTWLGKQLDTAKWVMAAITGISTFVSAGNQGNAYRRAWSTLSVKLTIYKTGNSSGTLSDVAKAYEQGESIIHGSNPSDQHV